MPSRNPAASLARMNTVSKWFEKAAGSQRTKARPGPGKPSETGSPSRSRRWAASMRRWSLRLPMMIIGASTNRPGWTSDPRHNRLPSISGFIRCHGLGNRKTSGSLTTLALTPKALSFFASSAAGPLTQRWWISTTMRMVLVFPVSRPCWGVPCLRKLASCCFRAIHTGRSSNFAATMGSPARRSGPTTATRALETWPLNNSRQRKVHSPGAAFAGMA